MKASVLDWLPMLSSAASERDRLNSLVRKWDDKLHRGGGTDAVRSLADFAREFPLQLHVPVMKSFNGLMDEVRRPADDGSVALDTGRGSAVNAVVGEIGKRNWAQIEVEKNERDFEIDLSGLDLRGIRLQGANLAHTILSGSDLTCAVLDNAKLTRVGMEGVKLARAQLANSDLGGADLRSGDLERACLRNAHLVAADLAYSDLEGAELAHAYMMSANLRRAILKEADLTLAILSRADLSGAVLEGANLTGATLTSAAGLTQSMLDSAWAEEGQPPKLDGTRCAETGRPLAWAGASG